MYTLCSNPDCSHLVDTSEGDIYTWNAPQDNIVFCSKGCSIMQGPSLLTLLTESFAEKGIPHPEKVAEIFISQYSPTIETLEETATVLTLRIHTDPQASLLSCVLTGDQNFAVHAGKHGIVHTPLRIGDFCALISRAHPSALLRSIELIKFTKEIPLGAGVILSATLLKERSKLRIYQVEGWLEHDRSAICHKTNVTTFGN